MKNIKTLVIGTIASLLLIACKGEAKKEAKTDNQQELIAKAKKAIEATEIYVQDGHDLKFDKVLEGCDDCYRFTFKHYGDPSVEYSMVATAKKDGSFAIEHTTFEEAESADNSSSPPKDYEETTFLRSIMGDTFDYYGDAKLESKKKLTIYGNSTPVVASTVSFTPKSVLDGVGKMTYLTEVGSNKVLLQQLGNTYELVKIFPNEFPFFVFSEITSKGNGLHHVYGLENGEIKNFLDNDWAIQTIGRKDMQHDYVPKALKIHIGDANGDGINDIVFKGEIENVNTKKKSEVKYQFVYNSQEKLFKSL